MLPVPTLTELADFSGRPQASYPAFATSALRQATLLMSINTCLVSMPTEADKAQMLKYGILELADDIVLKQPYKEISAKPFTSETLMSYSYTRSAIKAQNGEKTGLMWFDLAVQKLSVCGDGDDTSIVSRSVSIFEKEGVTYDAEGRPEVLGPASLADPYPLWTNHDNSGR